MYNVGLKSLVIVYDVPLQRAVPLAWRKSPPNSIFPIFKLPPSRNTAESKALSCRSAITIFIWYWFPAITGDEAVNGTVTPL